MSEAEVAAVLKQHDREMQEALKRLDSGRDKQADSLRQKLAERRRNRMGQLRNKHEQEVSRIYMYCGMWRTHGQLNWDK